MTCPHCGNETDDERKFCDSCSRLVNSPLLGIKRELDALRDAQRGAKEGGPRRSMTPLADRLAAKLASPAGHSPGLHTFDAPDTADSPFAVPRSASGEVTLPSWSEAARHIPGQADSTSVSGGARSRKKGRKGDSRHAPDTHRFENGGAAAVPTEAALPAGWPPERFARPPSIRVMAVVDAIAGLVLLALVAVLTARFPEPPRPLIVDYLRIAAGVLGVLFLVTARLLAHVRPIGLVLQRILAVVGFAAFPLGTLHSVVLLAYLKQPGMALLFSGRSPRQMTPKELTSVAGTLKFGPVMALILLVLSILGAINVVSFARATFPMLIRTMPQLLEAPDVRQD